MNRTTPDSTVRLPPSPAGRNVAVFLVGGLLLAGCVFLQPEPAAAGGPDTIRFKPLSCIDREGTGGEAFRMLVPDGWTFTGGIQWMLDNAGLPATAAFHAESPDKKTSFQVFPTQPFFWTNIPKILSEHPRGSRYYGREVLPPMQPVEALKQVVIPRLRPRARHLKVLEEQPLSDLARGLGAGVLSQPDTETSAWGARVRIQYIQDGIQAEEEIYSVVHTILFNFTSPTGTQTTMMWNVGYILSFRSEVKTFKERAGILQTLSFSFRWNPEWYNRYCQLVAYMMIRRVESLKDMAQLKRILGHTSNEISEAVNGYYREHQQVYTRISERFASVLDGVTPYHNPLNGEDLDLPSGYPGVWANEKGEYTLSRNPSFKPVPGPDGQPWSKIRPIGGP